MISERVVRRIDTPYKNGGALLAFALLALACSCRTSGEPAEDQPHRPTPEEAFSATRRPVHWTPLGSDADAARLVSGFFESDDPFWRWTEPRFQLYLDPLFESEKNYLVLEFDVPAERIEQSGTVSLTGFVEGEEVGKQEYTKEGRHEFSVEVPRRLTNNKAHVPIEFRVHPPLRLAGSGSKPKGVIVFGAGFRDYHSTPELRAKQKERARKAYAGLVSQYADRIPAADRDRLQRLFHEFDIWRSIWFQGVEIIKNPLDLWMAQQIIHELQPDYIVETGTFKGGSALYWAHTLQGMGLHSSRVLTVDIQNLLTEAPKNRLWDEYVEFFLGSSTSESVVSEIARRVEGKTTLVFLDSDHRAHHVRRELEMYAPLVSPGSYLIVEDTHIDALGTQPGIEAGPTAAIEEFLDSEPGKDFERDLTREAFVLTFNPGGWLQRRSN